MTAFDQIRQDLAYAARQLRRAPGFTTTAVAVLALGIGLNLAVFHGVKAIFADRLPVPDAETLMRVVRQSPGQERWAFPREALDFYREHAGSFLYLAGERVGTITVRVGDAEEGARAQFISGSYFDDLQVRPALGRLLGPADDAPGAPLAAVLSDGYFKRRLGGDPAVLSRPLVVNGLAVDVVGVMPLGFTGTAMSRGDLWLAASAQAPLLGQPPDEEALFGRAEMGIVGRLRPGVTREAASAQLSTLTAELRRQAPGIVADDDMVRTRAIAEDDLNRAPSLTLVPLVALVLLAACANLGNMLLARGATRRQEIAARIAVGASRARLVRQLMTESLLLAALGAVVGLVVGHAAAQALVAIMAGFLTVPLETDLTVVAAAGALMLLSAVVFGLAPALQLTARQPRHTTRSRQTLMAVQVAVSCVLLVLAGFLVRGTQQQIELADGQRFTSLVVVDPGPIDGNVPSAAFREILDGAAANVRALPEVAAVTIAHEPVYGTSLTSAPGLPMIVQSNVEPDYFAVMQLPLRQGRLFEPAEPGVVVISRAAARAAFEDDDAIGRPWNPDGGTGGPLVVGVVDDSPFAALRDPRSVEIYRALTDETIGAASVIARTTGDGRALLAQARDAAAGPRRTPTAWVMQQPVDQLLQHSLAATRMIGALGTAAAALAALGLFGLVAFTVRERTRELAIRIALGARARATAGMVLAQYARPLAIGLTIGIVLALAGAQMLLGLRLGLSVDVRDPSGYLLGLGVFTLTAIAAVLVPLRRAARIDPAAALRSE